MDNPSSKILGSLDPRYDRNVSSFHIMYWMRHSTASCCIIVCYLSSFPPIRWRNWWIRGFFTFVLIGMFLLFIVLGPVALTLMVSGCTIHFFSLHMWLLYSFQGYPLVSNNRCQCYLTGLFISLSCIGSFSDKFLLHILPFCN